MKIISRISFQLSVSVQFSHSVVSDSLQPYGLQHARLPCHGIHTHLLKFMSIKLVMPSNHLFLCCPLPLLLSIFPSIRSFPVSQFFTSGGQSVGVSASVSVLPMSPQDRFPLGLTSLIIQFKGLKSLLQHHSLKASILQC